MKTRLVSYRAGTTDLAFPVEGAVVTIGRADDNAIQLPDETVSKHHAALRPAEGGWSIEDLGSANGVFVNDKQVVPRMALKYGDRVRIGHYELFFESKEDPDEWGSSYLMDMSTKIDNPTIMWTEPPQKG